METLRSADSYYAQQQQIAAATVASAGKLWRRVGDDFSSDWAVVRPRVLEVVQVGRLAAATSSVVYTPEVLAETNQIAVPAGALVPSAFVQFAPDGRDMGTLLDQSVVRAKVAVGRGENSAAARAIAGEWLTGMLLTVMADTGRSVVGADIAQRPTLTGYVRMLNAPSCSRCVILAGKWFRWNQGFQRHPRCDCRHIPASENVGGDLRTDPYAYFNSLTPEAQTKAFGRIEARSIQDGGDIYRAVNIKARGLGTAKSNLRYGTPSKMTIDDIYRTAGTRSNAIRMMTEQGYITGPQTAGGNIFGRMRESYSVPISRPIVAGSNRDRVLTARSTGVRDPLDRATMTAAERRLFDAQYRLSEARTTGYWPRSVGANSADLFSLRTPLAPGDLALLETVLQKEIAKLRNAPASVRRLAALLRL